MRIQGRLAFCVVLLAFSVAASPAFPANQTPAPSDIVLEMDHGLTSLSARSVHLSRILEKIAARTGLTVVIDKQADPLLTIEIKEMPLVVALNRLLQEVSHAAIYERRLSEGRPDERVLVELHVYPKGKSGPSDDRQVFGSPLLAGLSAELYDFIPAREAEGEGAGARPMEDEQLKTYQEKKQLAAYTEKKQAIALLPAFIEEQGKGVDLSESDWIGSDELKAYIEKKKKQEETGEKS